MSGSTRIDLRAERHRRGLSAAKLADLIGVSEDVILYAERDPRRRPSPANAVKIADFFDIDVIAQWPLEPLEDVA